MMKAAFFLSFLSAVIVITALPSPTVAMSEEERLKEYHARNYTWPPQTVVPNTTGWRERMYRRFEQMERLTDSVQRYDGWMHAVTASLLSPNFTENGWGLRRAPPHLVQELKDALHAGLPTAREEYYINVIDAPEQPLFINTHEINKKVLEELKPLHEEWSGVELTGAIAYGLRAYRNQSSLFMHVDKIQTHVISCILHVDHSDDGTNWPLFIEDFQGNTNEVYLESGDMLFYESSKLIHGRPRPLNGSWYSSIFVHYYPTNAWDRKKLEKEVHYAVPPHWNQQKPDDPSVDRLVMSGTSMYEPDCPDRWCGTKNTVKWYGPAPEGVTVTTGYKPVGESSAVGQDEL